MPSLKSPLKQQLPLLHNFSWTFVGNIVYAACQWGMLAVLAKLGNPQMVGQFTLGLAVTAPVLMFTNLQLREVQVTDARNQFQFSDYLGLRLLGTGLALIVIAGITLKAGYRPETAWIIGLVGMAKAIEAISDVFYGLLQQQEQMDQVARSMMLKGLLALGGMAIGVALSGTVFWGVVGLLTAWILVLCVYDIPGILRVLHARDPETSLLTLIPQWHRPTLGKLVKLSLPLGFVMMLISLNLNIPRYYVEYYLGERQLGVFAAIAYLMVAGQMVILALGEAASPRLAKYYAAGDRPAFRGLLLKLTGLGAGFGLASILFALLLGDPFLSLVYRPEYGEQATLFVWLMGAAAINYVASFLGYGMTAARYFRVQLPLFTLVTGVSALSCLWLVPRIGLLGTGIALILSALVQVIVSLGVIFYALSHQSEHH